MNNAQTNNLRKLHKAIKLTEKKSIENKKWILELFIIPLYLQLFSIRNNFNFTPCSILLALHPPPKAFTNFNDSLLGNQRRWDSPTNICDEGGLAHPISLKMGLKIN